ncbi:MAG: DUF6261 family protein [Cytophagales bacterium]|nr:DUF6261 family protein [Cytophagales bacterium]
MLNKLRTSLLLPAELVETINSYLEIIPVTESSDAFLNVVTGLLREDVSRLSDAITAVRVNTLVNEVAELDAVRDDLFIGFRDMVDATKRRRDVALVQAHAAVWPVIEKAGTTLYALGYVAQSGRLEALFTELDKANHQTALATMGVNDIYTELKQAQQEFSEKYITRLDVDSQKTYPTMGEAKKKAVTHVNVLIDAINVLEEVNPGTYTDLIARFNVITASIMSVARTRKTRNESDTTSNEITEEEIAVI